MIIDKILDRKDGEKYNARLFYIDTVKSSTIFNDNNDRYNKIALALDSGDNKDVQKQLNLYIIENDYNPNIIEYINSVEWIR